MKRPGQPNLSRLRLGHPLADDPRYRLLRRLAGLSFPHQIAEPAEILAVMSLSAAGLIEADLPRSVGAATEQAWSGPAVVHRLTRAGHAAVSQLMTTKPLK